jgi:hypothetical protein
VFTKEDADQRGNLLLRLLQKLRRHHPKYTMPSEVSSLKSLDIMGGRMEVSSR